MNKKVRQAVVERSGQYCESLTCGRWIGDGGHLHHACGGNGKRSQHESEETCFMVCQDCHSKAHSNRLNELEYKLRAEINLAFKRLTESEIDDIRTELGGRLY